MHQQQSSGFFTYKTDNSVGMILLTAIDIIEWTHNYKSSKYQLRINGQIIYTTKHSVDVVNQSDINILISDLRLHIKHSINEDFDFNEKWVNKYDR